MSPLPIPDPARAISPWLVARRLFDLILSWLPLFLLAAALMFSIWLVRSTSINLQPTPTVVVKQEPDYDIRQFLLKTYDLQGQLKSSMTGSSAIHSPQTMTTLVMLPRAIIYKENQTTMVSAQKALTNEDGSEVQLIGNAVVHRNPTAQDPEAMNVQSEFLHFFANSDAVQTPLPVEISKGKNNFKANSMTADNLNQVMGLKGRVKAQMYPKKEE